MRKLKYLDAITEAIDEEMQRDDRVFLIGEDVGVSGGVWGTSRGLYEKYGAERVCDTPIAESAIVGTAVGAALTGLRPVAEMMYIDFVTCAMDQVVNQAAKLRLMSGNQFQLPLVIRGPQGCGTMEGAQHSGSLEAWFVHTPGLKVVSASTPYDVKGLLKTAIRDDVPVLFLEHRQLYGDIADVPEDETWTVPFGQAAIRREGHDVTVLSYSYMMQKAMKAAGNLASELSVEVIDLRTLVPLDMETIAKSIRKTNHVIIAHEAPARCGVGAEITRRILEEAFDYLDAPPTVVGGGSSPMPYSRRLEETVVPQVEDVIHAIRAVHSGHHIK
jgi:pyruvate dehydrogenase E1 component beta subunit